MATVASNSVTSSPASRFSSRPPRALASGQRAVKGEVVSPLSVPQKFALGTRIKRGLLYGHVRVAVNCLSSKSDKHKEQLMYQTTRKGAAFAAPFLLYGPNIRAWAASAPLPWAQACQSPASPLSTASRQSRLRSPERSASPWLDR